MRLNDLNVVLKIEELKSVTAAATQLGIRTATASMALKRVEQTLGAELFVRTTRQLRVTDAGRRYLTQCRQAVQLLENMGQQVKNEHLVMEEELRLSVSSDLGRNQVASWLTSLICAHPSLRLRLHISDSVTDFSRAPVDMALRYLGDGGVDEPHQYGFKLCEVPHLLCASPAYLNRQGVPAHPEELVGHTAVLYQLYDKVHDLWHFRHQDQHHKVRMASQLVANDGDLVRRWCVEGQGLAIKSSLDVAKELLRGELVPVMPEYQPVSTELWLVLPRRQLLTPAIQLLRDSLGQHCQSLLSQLVQAGLLPPPHHNDRA